METTRLQKQEELNGLIPGVEWEFEDGKLESVTIGSPNGPVKVSSEGSYSGLKVVVKKKETKVLWDVNWKKEINEVGLVEACTRFDSEEKAYSFDSAQRLDGWETDVIAVEVTVDEPKDQA